MDRIIRPDGGALLSNLWAISLKCPKADGNVVSTVRARGLQRPAGEMVQACGCRSNPIFG